MQQTSPDYDRSYDRHGNITDNELEMLIQALEATPIKARSIDQKWKLSALIELQKRRKDE
jgi:hypothetical protein